MSYLLPDEPMTWKEKRDLRIDMDNRTLLVELPSRVRPNDLILIFSDYGTINRYERRGDDVLIQYNDRWSAMDAYEGEQKDFNILYR